VSQADDKGVIMDLSFLLNAELLQKVLDVLAEAGAIVAALLAVIGGLKVLARYTSWEWDDKALDAADALLSKIRDIAAKLIPKGKQ
jgi:hypothetical protein